MEHLTLLSPGAARLVGFALVRLVHPLRGLNDLPIDRDGVLPFNHFGMLSRLLNSRHFASGPMLTYEKTAFCLLPSLTKLEAAVSPNGLLVQLPLPLPYSIYSFHIRDTTDLIPFTLLEATSIMATSNTPLKALVFDLMGTCLDWHSSITPVLLSVLTEAAAAQGQNPPSNQDVSDLALEWRQAFFDEIHTRFEAGEAPEDIDITHWRVLDRVLAEQFHLVSVSDELKNDCVGAWHKQQGNVLTTRYTVRILLQSHSLAGCDHGSSEAPTIFRHVSG